jgi:hypothetical protein
MFMQHFWRDVYHLSVLFFIDARCQTQNPKPKTQNSELYPKTQEVTYGKSRCYHRPRRRHPAGE